MRVPEKLGGDFGSYQMDILYHMASWSIIKLGKEGRVEEVRCEGFSLLKKPLSVIDLAFLSIGLSIGNRKIIPCSALLARPAFASAISIP